MPANEPTATIYRAGASQPTAYPQWLADRVAFMDSERPEGHVPRTGALYASVDPEVFLRWWRGCQHTWKDGRSGTSILLDPDWQPMPSYRLRVRTTGLHVYQTIPYELAVSHYDRGSEPEIELGREWARTYWASGIPLGEWLEGRRPAEQDGCDFDGKHEVLVPTTHVLSARPISRRWIDDTRQRLDDELRAAWETARP